MKISDEYHGCCSPLCQTWDVLLRLSFAEAHIFFLDKAPRLSMRLVICTLHSGDSELVNIETAIYQNFALK